MNSRIGTATYFASSNELEVIRPGESTPRRIRCHNLNQGSLRVHGVQVDGDAIHVLAGPRSNPRPDRKFIYFFSSLSGGGSSRL